MPSNCWRNALTYPCHEIYDYFPISTLFSSQSKRIANRHAQNRGLITLWDAGKCAFPRDKGRRNFHARKFARSSPSSFLVDLERVENSWWDKKKNSSKIGEKALILFIGSLTVSGHHVENWAPKFCLSPKMPRRWKSICFDSLFGDGAWRQRRFLGCNNSELSLSIFNFLRTFDASFEVIASSRR